MYQLKSATKKFAYSGIARILHWAHRFHLLYFSCSISLEVGVAQIAITLISGIACSNSLSLSSKWFDNMADSKNKDLKVCFKRYLFVLNNEKPLGICI